MHDYHLLLMGQELRASGWQGRMGFFLHIPFPAPEVFTALPQHQRLARGLCAFDLVGFQTDRDTANFLRYLVEFAGGIELDDGRVQVFDQTLRAETFSIGIDPDDIAALAGGEEGRAAAARLGRIIDNRALVIGVDRMDYSKGLPQRMEAFGRMLDDHEDLRGSVSFLQIAPPSREAVDAYQVLREELDRIVGPHQRRLCRPRLDADPLPRARLLPRRALRPLPARPRRARHPAARRHEPRRQGIRRRPGPRTIPGALVLSEFAGAAEQLQAALLVNPHDIAATADAIYRALSMPRRGAPRALAAR